MTLFCFFPRFSISEVDRTYYESYSTWRRRIHDMCLHLYWDVTIALVICLNVICMSLEHYQMSQVGNTSSIEARRRGGGGWALPSIGVCGTKGYGFSAVFVKTGYQFWLFWFKIGCGFCTLVFTCVCLLRRSYLFYYYR